MSFLRIFSRLSPIMAATVLALSPLAQGAPPSVSETPLFSKGLETFIVRDAKGNTPSFRVLHQTASERALALAVITSLNMAPETEKLPVKEYIDLKIEELTLQAAPSKANDLTMTAKVSGRYLEIPKPVDRAKFLAGETIEMSFPLTQKNVALFDVKSDGKIRFKWVPERKEIQILEGMGHINYAAPLLGGGDETIRFTGVGARKSL